MIEVVTDYLGAVQFECSARGHRIQCDQPVENGGFDEGMTPPEFFLAGVGACIGYYAAQYLSARKLSTYGLRVRTTAEKASAPARLGEIYITLEYPSALSETHREGILRAAGNCLIKNTLLHPPKIEMKLVVTAV